MEARVFFFATVCCPSSGSGCVSVNERESQVTRVTAGGDGDAAVRAAVDAMRRGLVVAYPTDTLYGLAVDPANSGAVTNHH